MWQILYADDRDMKKYIIGTIGSMDMPMEAVDMGGKKFSCIFLRQDRS